MGSGLDRLRGLGVAGRRQPAPAFGGPVMHPLLAATVVAAATWDSWRWYFARVAATPEEALSLAATVLFLAAIGVARASPVAPRPMGLAQVAILLGAYASTYVFLPPIMRAALAIAATLFGFHFALFRERPPIAFWGLVALALPVLPSLQFVLGYPMRVISAAITVALLQSHGFLIERHGTFIAWRDELIQFDAACSGVNMLWAGLMLTLMGCVLFQLRLVQVTVAIALSVVVVVGANVLRTSSLFYLE